MADWPIEAELRAVKKSVIDAVLPVLEPEDISPSTFLGSLLEQGYEVRLIDRTMANPLDVDRLSARLHDIYQAEAHRRGDVRHADAYDDLPDDTKEWDRVLARWVLVHWQPRFDPAEGFPPARIDGPGSAA